MNWKRLIVPWLAVWLDEVLGDPPNRWHPVAWLGSAIAMVERRVQRANPSRDFRVGLGVWLGGVTLVGSALRLITTALHKIPGRLGWIAEAMLLKLSLSPRGLRQAAMAVQAALEEEDLPNARKQVAWHLVSRDTQALDASQVAGATIESVAENASDGVLAPLLYYTIGGLPLVWVYRFANTLDSMWGYHSERYEWLGKPAARLDDLFNWLPARLTALCLVLAAFLRRENGLQALTILRRDARLTASPNAGYPMSAMAGALGVELEKVGQYRLGQGLPAPRPGDIRRAVHLMQTAVLLGMGLLSLITLLFHHSPQRTGARR
ncbi:MAG: cobalamin biosynthesis protein CobD [Anaerolineae bacterium]|jgi:adenosylcobinamide-phosphate synthase|nr:MAG: cobalamin biosynthesis protein CobD [Anaerolineae bacterium]